MSSPSTTAERVRNQFDLVAPQWDAEATDTNHYFTHRMPFVADLVAKHAPGPRTLDIGCAAGVLCLELARRGMDVHGADLSPEMLQIARKRLSGHFSDGENRFRASQNGEIPFEGCKFDAITMLWTLPYIPNRTDYVQRLVSHLNPGGCLVVSNCNRFSLHTGMSLLRNFAFFRPTAVWWSDTVNLWKTGFWSGGAPPRTSLENICNASRLDRLMRHVGLTPVDEVNFYCLQPSRYHPLDKRPLDRSSLGRYFARRLAWEHVGVYRL